MARIATVASFTPPVVEPAAPPTIMIAIERKTVAGWTSANDTVENPAVRVEALWKKAVIGLAQSLRWTIALFHSSTRNMTVPPLAGSRW